MSETDTSETILYLEDDESLAFVTKRALEKEGYQVRHSDTIEGFQACLAKGDFHYALLDLKIGNETSLALIQDIKSRRDIPVLILTGYGTIRTAVQAMKLGAIDFLRKPCSIAEILAAFKGTEADTSIAPESFETPSLKAIEWENIQKALDDNGGNISAAARQLKMHRRTLQRKLMKRHLDPTSD